MEMRETTQEEAKLWGMYKVRSGESEQILLPKPEISVIPFNSIMSYFLYFLYLVQVFM